MKFLNLLKKIFVSKFWIKVICAGLAFFVVLALHV